MEYHPEIERLKNINQEHGGGTEWLKFTISTEVCGVLEIRLMKGSGKEASEVAHTTGTLEVFTELLYPPADIATFSSTCPDEVIIALTKNGMMFFNGGITCGTADMAKYMYNLHDDNICHKVMAMENWKNNVVGFLFDSYLGYHALKFTLMHQPSYEGNKLRTDLENTIEKEFRAAPSEYIEFLDSLTSLEIKVYVECLLAKDPKTMDSVISKFYSFGSDRVRIATCAVMKAIGKMYGYRSDKPTSNMPEKLYHDKFKFLSYCDA